MTESGKTLWETGLPAGSHWSGVLRRGVTLRLTDTQGGANLSALFYNQEEKLERYNMADTLKGQHTAFLTKGHVCHSDMGRVLCSVTDDSCGWHDTISGLSTAEIIQAKYGDSTYQEVHNARFQNAHDSLINELGKYGLGRRDLVSNINFFSKVVVDELGNMKFVEGNSQAGDFVDLRFEMDCLVVLSTAPHPLDTSSEYSPKPVQLTAMHSGPAPAEDLCRNSCAENQRAFINTERYYLEV